MGPSAAGRSSPLGVRENEKGQLSWVPTGAVWWWIVFTTHFSKSKVMKKPKQRSSTCGCGFFLLFESFKVFRRPYRKEGVAPIGLLCACLLLIYFRPLRRYYWLSQYCIIGSSWIMTTGYRWNTPSSERFKSLLIHRNKGTETWKLKRWRSRLIYRRLLTHSRYMVPISFSFKNVVELKEQKMLESQIKKKTCFSNEWRIFPT